MKRHLLTVLLIVLSVFCCACNHPHTQLSFIAMDTYITLSADVNDGVLSSVRQKICSLSDTFDFHNSGSALSILNQNAGGPVDGDLNTLLQLARQYANDTGGAFNPALGNIIRLWDIGGQNRLPAAAQINDALAHSQSGDWQIQDGQVSLHRERPLFFTFNRFIVRIAEVADRQNAFATLRIVCLFPVAEYMYI